MLFTPLTPVCCEVNVLSFLYSFLFFIFVIVFLLLLLLYLCYYLFSNTIRPRTNIQKI